MNHELKQIKKKYGENFSHLCRNLFPTILEQDGLLLQILDETFAPNHYLYDDIINGELVDTFKDYIYSLYSKRLEKEERIKKMIVETPEELMDKAGYILKECKTEEEIQSYRKYYKDNEKLCTFNGGRLDVARVFFAVKKNVLDIKRENFINPRRQDEYGTSVISIQFTRDGTNTLSIKNRYNHTVLSPDATFSNDLDNIIAGLTDAFEETYGIVQQYKNGGIEIPNYVRANDGRFYKYNCEINNIYYCINNIIIDNYIVKKFDKEKYIVMDYFILNLFSKKIYLYDSKIRDSFVEGLYDIVKIDVLNNQGYKQIFLKPYKGEIIVLLLDKKDCILEYRNRNLIEIDNNFLYKNFELRRLFIPNVQQIGNHFLENNRKLEYISCTNIQKVGDNFLKYNQRLKNFIANNLRIVGSDFISENENIENIEINNVQKIGRWFLENNKCLKTFIAPNVTIIGERFLYKNTDLEIFDCPSLKILGSNSLYYVFGLKEFNAPNLNDYCVDNLNSCIKNIIFDEPKKLIK